jgi:hypothetical protein
MPSQFENFDKAYMAALTTLHESVSAKYAKKPIEVSAEQINEVRIINTLEGDITANPTDWIITGVKGEQYPVKDKEFQNLYEPSKDGKWKKKPLQVTAWQTDRELLIPYGNESLRASIGDYIVKQPNGSFAPVKPDIFKQTYDRCED